MSALEVILLIVFGPQLLWAGIIGVMCCYAFIKEAVA